jgi:hypothetical protein
VNSWKVILASLVIFGAGVVTGGLLVAYLPFHSPGETRMRPIEGRDHGQRTEELPRPALADRLSKQFLQQLDEKLQLMPEQKEKIQKILASGQERNHEIWTNVAPKMRLVIQEVNQQIRSELTPEQQKKFEELLKQGRPQRKSNPASMPPNVAPLTNSSAAAATKMPCV